MGEHILPLRQWCWQGTFWNASSSFLGPRRWTAHQPVGTITRMPQAKQPYPPAAWGPTEPTATQGPAPSTRGLRTQPPHQYTGTSPGIRCLPPHRRRLSPRNAASPHPAVSGPIWYSHFPPGYFYFPFWRKEKTLARKDVCTPIFIAALFIMAKIWKLTKCPSLGEQIKKRWYIGRYIDYIAILLSHKKELKLTICDNMDGSRGHFTQWNKSDRERQRLYDFICMWI